MAKHSVRNFSSTTSAFAVTTDVILEDEALKELDVKYGGKSPTPSQMAVHYSAGLAAATQGDLNSAQRHLSWLAGCFNDLDNKFDDVLGGRIYEMYNWEPSALSGEQKELYQTAQLAVKYIRAVAREAGLHYWPGMLVPHQSLTAMLRAEQLRLQWLKCEPWTEKNKGGGWDAMGYYGWNASRVLSMFRRAGCKLGPRFDRMLRLHHEGLPTNCMKRSFSEEKQLAVARGWRVSAARTATHSNQALAVLGRMDPRVAVAAKVTQKAMLANGFNDRAPARAPARARHISMADVARATELWRQIDAGGQYSTEDVLWYASHIARIDERYRFLLRALPRMKGTYTVEVISNGKLAPMLELVQITAVGITTVIDSEAVDPVTWVHLAYAAGKVWYATYHEHRYILTEVMDGVYWFNDEYCHMVAVNAVL